MPNTTPTKKFANIANSTPLFTAYLNLKKQRDFREAYTKRFGFTERTLYNRMTASGIAECSEAEIEWFCEYFVKSRTKLFPNKLMQAA